MLIIFDENKISEHTIHNFMNNVDEHLEFKMSMEENRIINCLDLSINRNAKNVDLSIYRKPTYIDITIYFSSKHPHSRKLAACSYYINRMIKMPISEQAIKQEWNKILTMAQNNGFPSHLIHRMKRQLMAKKEGTTQTQVMQQYNKKWVTFTYHSPSIHKVTNLNLKIAFRPTNTIYQRLLDKVNNPNLSVIYQIKCNTCNRAVIGQSGRPITTRDREHLRYIRNNNPTSAYAIHILDNRNEFCPAEETLQLLKPCTKDNRMNCWESLFIHIYHKHNILIGEKQAIDTNPLFKLASVPVTLCTSRSTVYAFTVHNTHTTQSKSYFILFILCPFIKIINILHSIIHFYILCTYRFITVILCRHSTGNVCTTSLSTLNQTCNFS